MRSKDKILDLGQLLELVAKWKKENQKVVFTNGCFDIVHLGHVDYLEKARELGDKLVVGLNTDASVSRLKGPARPVVDEYARARMIASFSFVDAVTYFEEDTPYELIKKIIPDILVKGDDYSLDNIVGADIVMGNGGNVSTIKLVDGYSTTKIIGKIKNI